MELNENSQKVINVLRSHGKKTLNVLLLKTSLSESVVKLELKQLEEGDLVVTSERLGLITYRLNKNKYNCRWSGHESGSDYWICIHPDTDILVPCKNDESCGRHRFLDEPDVQ